MVKRQKGRLKLDFPLHDYTVNGRYPVKENDTLMEIWGGVFFVQWHLQWGSEASLWDASICVSPVTNEHFDTKAVFLL